LSAKANLLDFAFPHELTLWDMLIVANQPDNESSRYGARTGEDWERSFGLFREFVDGGTWRNVFLCFWYLSYQSLVGFRIGSY
jgi:hypothetical protein